jgi:anti-anti-sigma factor
MALFSVRDEPDGRVIVIEDTVELNDFRPNSLRESLQQAVSDEEGRRVALDLAGVDFLSSSGVATLVGLQRRLDKTHGKLVLFSLQPMVIDLLKVTRLTQYFTFAPDEPSALELLRSFPPA